MTYEDSDVKSRVGGGIGSAIGGRIVQAVTDAKRRAAPIQKGVAETAFAAITNHVSDEVRGMTGHLFRSVAEHPDTPEELRPLFRGLGNRRGQAMGWIGGAATGAAVGGGLSLLMANTLNPAITSIIARTPAMQLTPETAAQGEARDIAYSRSWAREAAYSGIDGERFRAMVAMHYQSLTPEQIQVLVNRGRMPTSTATALLRSQGYRPDVIDDILALRTSEISPETAAAMWNRNLLSTQEGRGITQRWGLDADEFDRLAALGGEPPATQELLLAWRRGVVDESDVNRALVQGPLRNEWIPVIKQLQWEPLSPNDAADSVNQGHLDLAAAQREASHSGVRPEHFRLMIENAGLPPGIEFADEAYNRGLLSDDEWTRMFLESRIKNRYIPVMKAMRTRIVPQETIRLLWREGVYSDAEAVDGLMGHGFTQRDAEALLQLERERRTQGTKDLTRAQIIDLFEEDIISDTQARQALGDQGYDTTEVEWMMSIAEVNKTRRFINAATTRIKNAYVRGTIDETEASGRLDELGYGPVQKSNLLAIWDVERDVSAPQLTVAQITAAAKRGFITWDEAESRLLVRGYDPIDAAIVLGLAGRPGQPT